MVGLLIIIDIYIGAVGATNNQTTPTGGELPNNIVTSNTASCNYNGRLQGSQCICDAAWEGDACDILSLQPTDKRLGYRGKDGGKNVTSWGGSVVLDDEVGPLVQEQLRGRQRHTCFESLGAVVMPHGMRVEVEGLCPLQACQRL